MEDTVRWVQQVVAAAATPQGVEYILNDPTTPALVDVITPPVCSGNCPDYTVVGHVENDWGAPGTLQYQASQVNATLVYALLAAGRYFRTPVTSWAATQNLVAIPRAGRQFNAYYDRVSLRFFQNEDPVTKKMVYTCESQDVVSHEAGHAILDSRRPDLWNMQAIEVMAMHEAFGDIQAILTILQHDKVVDWVLKETDGDLTKPSVVTRVGEEMGQAIYNSTQGRMGNHADALRNAINDFTYSTPETLPQVAKDDQLAREPHSFSRVFVGTFWEILRLIFDREVAAGRPPSEAIRTARDAAGRLAYLGYSDAKAVGRFMTSVAGAMLRADTEGMAGKYADILSGVFSRRNLLPAIIPLAFAPQPPSVATATMPARGLDLPVVASMSAPQGSGVSEVLVQLPMAAMGMPEPTEEASLAMEYLESNGLVGEEAAGKMFSVADGQLVRNFMCYRGC